MSLSYLLVNWETDKQTAASYRLITRQSSLISASWGAYITPLLPTSSFNTFCSFFSRLISSLSFCLSAPLSTHPFYKTHTQAHTPNHIHLNLKFTTCMRSTTPQYHNMLYFMLSHFKHRTWSTSASISLAISISIQLKAYCASVQPSQSCMHGCKFLIHQQFRFIDTECVQGK